MGSLPQHVKEVFFQSKMGYTSKDDFEDWLYQHLELENYLSSDEYFELISFSYKSAHEVDFVKLIDKFVEPAEFEYYVLMLKLVEALDRGKHPNILDDFYSLYVNGYSFMNTLGLVYGLSYAEACINLGYNSIEARKKINEYFPAFEIEIMKVKNLLETGKIVLKGKDEKNRFTYLDLRDSIEAP